MSTPDEIKAIVKRGKKANEVENAQEEKRSKILKQERRDELKDVVTLAVNQNSVDRLKSEITKKENYFKEYPESQLDKDDRVNPKAIAAKLKEFQSENRPALKALDKIVETYKPIIRVNGDLEKLSKKQLTKLQKFDEVMAASTLIEKMTDAGLERKYIFPQMVPYAEDHTNNPNYDPGERHWYEKPSYNTELRRDIRDIEKMLDANIAADANAVLNKKTSATKEKS